METTPNDIQKYNYYGNASLFFSELVSLNAQSSERAKQKLTFQHHGETFRKQFPPTSDQGHKFQDSVR